MDQPGNLWLAPADRPSDLLLGKSSVGSFSDCFAQGGTGPGAQLIGLCCDPGQR